MFIGCYAFLKKLMLFLDMIDFMMFFLIFLISSIGHL